MSPPPAVLLEQQRRVAELTRKKNKTDQRQQVVSPAAVPHQEGPTGPYPAYTAPASAPPRAVKAGLRAGVVQDLQNRSESRGDGQRPITQQVYTFRLERYDDAGNRLPPIPVELRGETLWGVVNNGDWVQVPDSWQTGQTLRARQLTNLTTGSEFGAGKTRRVARTLIATFLVIYIAGSALFEYTQYRGPAAPGGPANAAINFGVLVAGGVVFFGLLILLEQSMFRRKMRAGR